MASTFGNWSMPYWSGLASAERSANQLYQDWLRGQQHILHHIDRAKAEVCAGED